MSRERAQPRQGHHLLLRATDPASAGRRNAPANQGQFAGARHSHARHVADGRAIQYLPTEGTPAYGSGAGIWYCQHLTGTHVRLALREWTTWTDPVTTATAVNPVDNDGHDEDQTARTLSFHRPRSFSPGTRGPTTIRPAMNTAIMAKNQHSVEADPTRPEHLAELHHEQRDQTAEW